MKIEATASDYCMTIEIGSDWIVLTREEAMQLEEEISANLPRMAVQLGSNTENPNIKTQ